MKTLADVRKKVRDLFEESAVHQELRLVVHLVEEGFSFDEVKQALTFTREWNEQALIDALKQAEAIYATALREQVEDMYTTAMGNLAETSTDSDGSQ